MRTAARGPALSILLAASLAVSMAAQPVAAETVYVGDRFEIGVHDNTDIDSVIVAVIPSGTPLTVMDRAGEYVEVTTPDGIKGWVDARYVVSEKPSVALLSEHDAKLQEAVKNLGDARAEVEVLRQRVTELQRDAATATQMASSATQPVSLGQSEDEAKLRDAERRLDGLSEENRQLKEHVADLRATRDELEQAVAESRAEIDTLPSESIWQGPVSNEGRTWTPWQWLLFASILLLAFAAGGYAVDWASRRRHGGFRI